MSQYQSNNQRRENGARLGKFKLYENKNKIKQ